MDFEAAKHQRDRRLRRLLLVAVYESRGEALPLGARTAIYAAEAAAGNGQGFEDDQHAVQLIQDLADKELVRRDVVGLRVHQRLRPEHVTLRITDKGSRLIREQIAPDPDVYDDRLEVN